MGVPAIVSLCLLIGGSNAEQTALDYQSPVTACNAHHSFQRYSLPTRPDGIHYTIKEVEVPGNVRFSMRYVGPVKDAEFTMITPPIAKQTIGNSGSTEPLLRHGIGGVQLHTVDLP